MVELNALHPMCSPYIFYKSEKASRETFRVKRLRPWFEHREPRFCFTGEPAFSNHRQSPALHGKTPRTARLCPDSRRVLALWAGFQRVSSLAESRMVEPFAARPPTGQVGGQPVPDRRAWALGGCPFKSLGATACRPVDRPAQRALRLAQPRGIPGESCERTPAGRSRASYVSPGTLNPESGQIGDTSPRICAVLRKRPSPCKWHSSELGSAARQAASRCLQSLPTCTTGALLGGPLGD